MESLQKKLDKKEITPDQVIKAAIIQLKETPSLLEIANQEEALSKEKLAILIIKASESNKDFLTVLKEEIGNISPLIEKKKSHSKPLRELLSELKEEPNQPTDFFSDDREDKKNQTDEPISDAALESLKEQVEAGVISPEALEEFQSQNTSEPADTTFELNEKEKNQVAEILSRSLLHELSLEFKGLTSQSNKNLNVSLENLKDKFDSLTDLTAELRTPLLTDLCREMSEKIQALNQPPHKQSHLIALYKLFALIVKVKKGILETGSEESVSNQASFNQELTEIRNKFY